MSDEPPIIARAFELAPSCSSLKDLYKLLRQDGHTGISIECHLSGLGIRRELKRLYNGGRGAKKKGPKQLERDSNGRYLAKKRPSQGSSRLDRISQSQRPAGD